ncbi:MAG TPA: Re/Si-specific NAD(P)(+) transhydrogenase subunit alpha [Nitrospiria bacterium]|jgi:NAD(P) transhydrogenase subunit alpha|nr:Re/Si-specific NAD(P)(+) transhydrogenase subunit alpha [Nitrospiria bacterium]
MIVGVPKETFPGERRVALVPAVVPVLVQVGFQVLIEAGAGEAAGFSDGTYQEKGARIAASRDDLFRSADIILQVLGLGANPEAGRADLNRVRPDQILVGLQDPLSSPRAVKDLAERRAVVFALELLPRTTRAQSMDVLSSMATIAGYKAVLLAAETLPRIFPMMMTAAGTVNPARVFVIGAGVAGLQAIATARRLGAVVQAYDVRPAVKEQVQSVGGKFVDLPLDTSGAESGGGYARVMDESFYRRQRETMARVVAGSDVVLCTAAIPGKPAPVLVTGEMVSGMAAGSVIVDLAAENGGNCELTQPGRTLTAHRVTIIGPVRLAATVPYHASQLYAKNISTFLTHIVKEGKLRPDPQDAIVSETLVARDGTIVHPRIRELLGPTAASPRG